jgi:hypothetical protein
MELNIKKNAQKLIIKFNKVNGHKNKKKHTPLISHSLHVSPFLSVLYMFVQIKTMAKSIKTQDSTW